MNKLSHKAAILFFISLIGAYTTYGQTPIRALLFTGGCCHDYTQQIPLLTSNINRQTPVQFKIAWTLDLLTNEAFAKSYDVIVYDLCFDNAADQLLDNALNTL